MSETIRWVDRFEKLLGDGSFQSDLAQINARALLGEILTESPINWNYFASTRIIRNLTAASMAIDVIANKEPERLDEFSKPMRRIASAWEGLARIGDKINRNSAYLNAAAIYEIAGFQANASCLAKLVTDVTHSDTGSLPNLGLISSKFLQRLFIQTCRIAKELEREPDETDLSSEQISQAAAYALAAFGLEKASRFFLSGDTRLVNDAEDYLKESQELLVGLGLHREYNLVRNSRTLLPLMARRSTWTYLRGILSDPLWDRYLRLLARGIGADILSSRSVSELWPSQVVALNAGLLGESSKFVRMPTSAGKTRIAEMAMVHTLISKAKIGAKCIYIAPYRALVWELEQSFLNLFGDLGFRVSTFIGSYESDVFQEILAEDADILVLTPEKLDLLQRASPQFLEKVNLIIMDEGQIMNERARGVKFELLMTRLKMQLKSARFLFLSAVVPQETLEDFASWLKADKTKDLAVTNWRPSQQRHAMFRWSGERGFLTYSTDPDLVIPREFVPGVLVSKNFRFVNPKTRRLNNEFFPISTNKAQVAAELAFVFSDLGPVLVFCAQTPSVNAVGKALLRRLDLTRWSRAKIPEHFRPRDGLRSTLAAEEWLGKDHLVTKLLRSGIAVHSANLPDHVRKAVESDFRNHEYQVIVATSTLAQGVNLPIKTVIMHSCRRYLSDEQPSVPIPARDYWNIAGRAGRAGEETEGTIIHIVENRTDEEDFRRYALLKAKVEPVHSALLQMVQDLTNHRITSEEAKSMLNPEMLAVLVEEVSGATTESTISDVLDGSLLRVQSESSSKSSILVRETLLESANEIRNQIQDRELLKAYSATGLGTNSCELLRGYIEGNQDKVRSLLRFSGQREDLQSSIVMVLEACNPLVEIQARTSFAGSVRDLLLAWIDGVSVAEIYSRYATESESAEDLARFISEFFSYKLPWGVSAFLRISTHVLGIDEAEVSVEAKFLPSLIKFGVPTPMASWAISSGVPSRSAAIRLAEGYLLERDKIDSKEFLAWFNDLDYETLFREYGIEGQVLDEISRAVNRSGVNSLLKHYGGPEKFYPTETWIRGIKYDNRRMVALKAKVGQSVTLVRDYDNVSDRNAVEVWFEGEPLGFIARNLAQVAAVDIDAGLPVTAKIAAIERREIPEVKLRLSLEQRSLEAQDSTSV